MTTRNLEFPDPDFDGQLEAAIDAVETGGRTATWLRDQDFRREAAGHALATLAEARDRVYTISRTVGLAAIAAGRLTQTEVADLIGVHPQTINRWVAEAREHPEPDRDYVADPYSATKKPRRRQSA